MINTLHIVDWISIISMLEDGIDILPLKERWNTNNKELLKIYQLWQDANFNMSAIKWTNFYPGKHFDQHITDSICNFLGVREHRSWISKIDPGFCAPWHWDVDDNEHDYLKNGPILRYSAHISPAHPGHVFVVEDSVCHMWNQGDMFRWKNYNSWHAGMNAGTTSKYLFNLIAYS